MRGELLRRSKALWLAAALGSVVACGPASEAPAPVTASEQPPSVTATPELAGLEPRDWVSIYDPQRAWGGYTVAFYRARIPILIDMNGRIVHAWGKARGGVSLFERET